MEREQLGPRWPGLDGVVYALAVVGRHVVRRRTVGGELRRKRSGWAPNGMEPIGPCRGNYGPPTSVLCSHWRCRAPPSMQAAMTGSSLNIRKQLDGAGFGVNGSGEMHWQCRAALCMRAAISRQQVATRPIASRNGMGPMVPARRGDFRNSRHWNRPPGFLRLAGVGQHALCGRPICETRGRRRQWPRAMGRQQLAPMGAGISGQGREFFGPRCLRTDGLGRHSVCGRRFHGGGGQRGQIPSRNGMAAVGRRWERGLNDAVLPWKVSGARCNAGGFLHDGRQRQRPMASPNGTVAVGRGWDRAFQGATDLPRPWLRWSFLTAHYIVGGDFTNAGGGAANSIAQWNGSNWSALGSGMNSYVYGAGGVRQPLYAGRRFHDRRRQRANSIAQMERSQLVTPWAGTDRRCVLRWRWQAARYMPAGNFTTAGGRRGQFHRAVERRRPGRHSGWGLQARASDGYGPYVDALALSAASCVWAGISRMRAAGRPIPLPQWNGSSWLALGSGMNGRCLGLAVSGPPFVCGRHFHHGGRQRGQLIRAMERQTVGPRSVRE